MMGGQELAKDKSAPDYSIMFTLGLISGGNGGCSAAHTEPSTWGN